MSTPLYRELNLKDGTTVRAACPRVLSVSRATDIPALYGAWFMHRLKEGCICRVNPFNGKRSWLDLSAVQAMVFWTKNPRPFFRYLPELERRGLAFYFQFTLNDYVAEGLEPFLPSLEERIASFKALSGLLGSERVLWRADPLLLCDSLSVSQLLERLAHVGDSLQGLTDTLTFSFIDIAPYRKVQSALRRLAPSVREFSADEIQAFAGGLNELNKNWGLKLCTCAEAADLSAFGIEKGACIDAKRLGSLSEDDTFRDFLERQGKDRGQRRDCLCISARDVGAYDSCTHGCVYCYATRSRESALKRRAQLLKEETSAQGAEVIPARFIT